MILWTKDAKYYAVRPEEKRRFMDGVKDDMHRIGVTKEDGMVRWRVR